MQEKLQKIIKESLKNLGIEAETVLLEHPVDLVNGDYSTNVALAYAKQTAKNPKVLAEEIAANISHRSDLWEIGIEKTEIAGPGFINFYLSKEFFAKEVAEVIAGGKNFGNNTTLSGKKVIVEYTQPNPFKPFHIGHLMSNAIGESIVRLVEASGAETIRANYQGDVGPHVAKAIWGMIKSGPPKDEHLPSREYAEYIGKCYANGSDAYENIPEAKQQIDTINKQVYEKSDSMINALYTWGRKVTLEAFEEIYKTLGTHFDRYYFESEMAPIGEKIVRENIGPVFEESDGAIVFKADKHDPKLHTRVFINSQGLPTYETKEVGLTVTKFKEKNPDISIVTTAVEQADYMRVVEKAISLMHPDLAKRMKHITHGMMRFATGKMSSRTGNVVTGESLIRDVQAEITQKIADRGFDASTKEKIATEVGVAALKYSILKQSLGADIVYDFEKSISFEGDSGPYLQYSFARARSIVGKAGKQPVLKDCELPIGWETTEIEKMLYRFPEVVLHAASEYEPHHIATYLIDLSRAFNTFYGNTKIIDEADNASSYKVALTSAFATVIQNGLYLLGIETPEKM